MSQEENNITFSQIYKKLGFSVTATILVLFVGFLSIKLGDRIPVGNGLGYGDATVYALYVVRYDSLMDNKKINTVWTKRDRFLPSIVVHHGLDFFGVDLKKDPRPMVAIQKNIPTITNAFNIYNLILLALAAFIWGMALKKVGVSDRAKWLSIVFIYGSYVILNFNFWYPTLTDTSGMVFSMIMLSFFILGGWQSIIGIFTMGLLGAFAWQPVLIYAYILLLFPRESIFLEKKGKINTYLGLVIPTFFSLGFAYMFYKIYSSTGLDGVAKALDIHDGQLPMNQDTAFIAMILTVITIFTYFYYLFRNPDLKNFSYFIKPRIAIGVVAILALFFSVNQIHDYVNLQVTTQTTQTSQVQTGTDQTQNTNVKKELDPASKLIKTIIDNPLGISGQFYRGNALQYPLAFVVAHIVYFGPVFLLFIVFFKPISKEIRKYGIGIVLIFFASTSFLLIPQSRTTIAVFPFIVFFTILIIDKYKWKNEYYWFLIGLTFFASKIWLSVDIDPKTGTMPMYFVNIGNWMPEKWHYMQGFLALLVAGYFIKNYKELTTLPKEFQDLKENSSINKKTKK